MYAWRNLNFEEQLAFYGAYHSGSELAGDCEFFFEQRVDSFGAVLFGCRFAQPDRPHGLCPSHPLDGAGAVQETKPASFNR